MPVLIDQVFYELALHDKDFAEALRKAAKNLDGLDDTAKKAADGLGNMEKATGSLTKQLKELAQGLALGFVIKGFIANTIDAQRALAQMQAALKSTGGAAGFSLPELVKYSEELSHLSTFSSEAVQGGLSRLLTYTGLQGDMFKQAARATVDFATALGIDTTSAAERVGNALQYPTEAINSLTKQGFRFSAEQKRQIALFESTGQLAKAQAIILGELDLAYKGSAEAARNTLGGALQGLKNDFTSTLEVSKESSSGLIEAINAVASAMPALRDKFSAFFGGISLMAVDASIRMQKFLRLLNTEVRFTVGAGFRGFPAIRGHVVTPKDALTDEQLEQFRAEETRRILGLDTPAAAAGKKPPKPPTPGLTDAQIAAQKAARAAFEQALAGQTTGGVDNFEAQVAKLVSAAQKAHIGALEIQKMVTDLRDAHAKAMAEEGQKLALTLQQQLAQLTTTTVDDLRAQLAEFDRTIDEQRAKGVPIDQTVVNQLRAAKEQAIALAPKIEEIERDLAQINASAAAGNLGGALSGLSVLIDKSTEIRDQLREREGVAVGHELEGSVELKAAQERVNALIARELEIRKQLRVIMLANANAAQRLAANIEDVAGGVANAANAAFGLASAFLGVDSNITKALGSLGQLAGGISDVSGLATKAGGFGKLFSTGGGIASALPGIGQAIGGAMALANSLFGTSPEELARRKMQKDNTEALRQLSKNIGDLGRINVSGTQLGQLTKFFQQPQLGTAAKLGNISASAVNALIGQALTAVGLSAKEFKDLMRSFGLAIDDAAKITIADVNALKKAMLESELTQFAHTFEGQMSQFNAAVKIFDLSKPIDQFNALRKAIGTITGGGGALGKLLDTFDLTTAGGINDAITALQNLFTQLQTLSPDQAAAFLGGLTPEQFEQLIEQTIGIVRSQAGSGAVPGTGGFNVDRTITEVTGNRLEALLSTDVIWNQKTAENTALIAQLLGGGNTLPVIQPPASSASSFASSGGPLVTIENLTVQVSGLTDPSRADEIGARVGTSVLEEIDRGLGQRLKFAKLAKGLLT
jgi:hypothetical protein